MERDLTIIEVCQAIDNMKNDKAMGKDKIPIEIFKYVQSVKLVKMLVILFNKSLNSGIVDNIIKDVIIAVLFKKGSAMDCINYRGLSLISHIGKVLERLIQNRLVKYVEEVIYFIPENQNGFRSARSTIDSIFCSRIISSYCREKHNICIKCFVDLTKAYDKVDRDVLWLILKRIGVPNKLIEIIKNIHVGATGSVRTEGEFSESFSLGVGLKQGSIFAPLLFNIYFTAIINAVESKLKGCGIKLRFRLDGDIFNVENLKAKTKIKFYNLLYLLYADDCELVASSVEEMQLIIDVFDHVSKIYGQIISIKKTEILNVIKESSIVSNVNIKIDNTTLQCVNKFKYVGSIENNNGTMIDEIKMRIQLMAMSFNKLSRRLFLNKNISIKVKLMMFEIFILSVGLYESATWNTSTEDIRLLEVWHQRALRKIFHIKWFDHVSFLDIVNLAAKYDYKILPLECRVRQNRLKYFGHIERMNDNRLPKILLHSECEYGQRLVGQPETNYRNCIKKDLLLFNIKDWKTVILDRKSWRSSIFYGQEYFLKNWWKNWIEKYYARHKKENEKTGCKKVSKKHDVESKLGHILEYEKNLLVDIKSSESKMFNVSFVKEILLIDNCIQDMISELEMRERLDRLESNIVTGSRNVLITDSVLNYSKSRSKYRKVE